MATDVDKAWAAGFFDGEGSISIRTLRQNGHVYRGLYIRVAQVDRTPLDRLVTIFGVGVTRLYRRHDDRRAPYHDWYTAGISAAGVLEQMLPYLTVKRTRALLAIEFQQLVGTRGRGNRTRNLSLDEQLQREVIWAKMRYLNLRQVPRAAAETKSSGDPSYVTDRSDSPDCTDDKGAEAGRNDQPRRLKIVGA